MKFSCAQWCHIQNLLANLKCPNCFSARVKLCEEETEKNAECLDCQCRFEFNPELRMHGLGVSDRPSPEKKAIPRRKNPQIRGRVCPMKTLPSWKARLRFARQASRHYPQRPEGPGHTGKEEV